eukprot:753677-Karenia_brevis.AAC.1
MCIRDREESKDGGGGQGAGLGRDLEDSAMGARSEEQRSPLKEFSLGSCDESAHAEPEDELDRWWNSVSQESLAPSLVMGGKNAGEEALAPSL